MQLNYVALYHICGGHQPARRHDAKCSKAVVEGLKAAVDAGSSDPVGFIGEFMIAKSAAKRGKEEGVSGYKSLSILGVATGRAGWLVMFLFGLVNAGVNVSSFGPYSLIILLSLLLGHEVPLDCRLRELAPRRGG